ncbi:MAG: hypothetical protein QXJ50_00085 [Candidatus Woesearchaeota archaeon]
MEEILIVNAVFFFLATLLCWILTARINKEEGRRLVWSFIFLSGFYLASGVLNIFWAFSHVKPSELELILAGSAFITPLAALLSYIAYLLAGDKRIILFMTIFSMAAVGMAIIPGSFLFILNLLSFLLLMLLGVMLRIAHNPKYTSSHKAISEAWLLIALYGLLGSVISLFSSLRILVGKFWFAPLIFLCAALMVLIRNSGGLVEFKDAERSEGKKFEEGLSKNSLRFVHYLFFMISMLTFLFASTIAVHELGHGLVGLALNCSCESVIFSSDANEHFFTKVTCNSSSAYLLVRLGGVLFPLLLSALLLLSDGVLVKNLGVAALAISIYISNADLASMQIPLALIVLFNILAVLFIFKALFQLADYYCSEDLPENKRVIGQKI